MDSVPHMYTYSWSWVCVLGIGPVLTQYFPGCSSFVVLWPMWCCGLWRLFLRYWSGIVSWSYVRRSSSEGCNALVSNLSFGFLILSLDFQSPVISDIFLASNWSIFIYENIIVWRGFPLSSVIASNLVWFSIVSNCSLNDNCPISSKCHVDVWHGWEPGPLASLDIGLATPIFGGETVLLVLSVHLSGLVSLLLCCFLFTNVSLIGVISNGLTCWVLKLMLQM